MDTASKLEAHERECSIRYASFEDKLDHIDKRLWRLEALMMAYDADHRRSSRRTVPEMTQLVFALIVTMGAQTISVEHWSPSNLPVVRRTATSSTTTPTTDTTNATRASTRSAPSQG